MAARAAATCRSSRGRRSSGAAPSPRTTIGISPRVWASSVEVITLGWKITPSTSPASMPEIDRALALQRRVGLLEQDAVAALLGEIGDPACELGEVGERHVGECQGEQSRASGREPAAEQVGAVAELVDGTLNALAHPGLTC